MHSKKLPFNIGNQINSEIKTVNIGTVPRVKRLLALACHYDKTVVENPYVSQNMLVSLLPITRVRLTQILNLNFLSNHIKNEIMDMPNTFKGKDRISTKIVVKISQELPARPLAGIGMCRMKCGRNCRSIAPACR